MTTTPQSALLSEAERCAKNLNKWNANDDCWSPEHIRARSEAELRRLDALVAHLTEDRDDTANELALRTKHNLALTNERDQILAKLQATQEPVQAGELPAFEQWWRQRQLLTFPKDYDQSLLADWGAAYEPAAKDAWQARAALSARKPLPYDLICNAIDLADTESMKGDYMLDYSDCIAVVRTMQALIEINGIGLEVKP